MRAISPIHPIENDDGAEMVSPQSTMGEVLEAWPGAQRALFRRYHIGGCSSCGFQPQETLEQVCRRNGGLDVNEILGHLQTSYEQDAKLLIGAKELAELVEQDKSVRLLDVCSREELEAAHPERAGPLFQQGIPEIIA